jgi:hypothetical protein
MPMGPNLKLRRNRDKAVFARLIELQDGGMGIHSSELLVCTEYMITRTNLKQIEERGMKNSWPPLVKKGKR